MANLEINVFSKKLMTKEGKTFYNYFGRLTRKDGTEIPVTVKFKDTFGQDIPLLFPVTINFDKKDANLSKREYENKEGQMVLGYTLWLNKWEEIPFVDDSLDDFI